jgi:hypothetical protein
MAAHRALLLRNPVLSFCPKCEEWVRYLDEVQVRFRGRFLLCHVKCGTECTGSLGVRMSGFDFPGDPPSGRTVVHMPPPYHVAPRAAVEKALAERRRRFPGLGVG